MKFDLLVWLLLVPSAEGASSEDDLVDHTGLIQAALSLSLLSPAQQILCVFIRAPDTLRPCAAITCKAGHDASACSHLRLGHGWHEHVPDGLRADP